MVAASALIARVRADQPLVVALARMLSIAANVEVSLVRRIRRALLRQADVRVEADLWASALVEVRGMAELRLRSDVQQAFWIELGEDPAALEAIWTVLAAVRTKARPLLVLEERLTYLAIKGEVEFIDQELGSVIRAMLGEPDRRRDLAAWSARALARLPDMVRKTEAARVLAMVARSWVATPVQVAKLTPTPEGARLASQMIKAGPTIPVHLRLVRNMLVVGGAKIEPCETIEVSAGAPSIILDEDDVVQIDPRRPLQIPLTVLEVMIGTLDGRRWLLNRVAPRPDLEAIGVLHGLTSVRVVYLIEPTLAATSAGNIEENVRFVDVQIGGEVVSGQLVVLDREADIALLELPSSEPERHLTLERLAGRGKPCQVYVLPDEVRPVYGTLISETALRFSGDHVPWESLRPGIPVFWGDAVIGHLRGVPLDGMVSLAPARSILWWVERTHAQGPSVEDEERHMGGLPVLLRLPAWVALDGLLGKRVVREGPLQRFRSHVWGDHEITVVYGYDEASLVRGSITVEVTLVEGGVDDGELVAFVAHRDLRVVEAGLFAACERAIRRFGGADVVHGDASPIMLDIRVRRRSGLSLEFAVRRGVRFMIEVLAELAGRRVSRSVLAHVPKIGMFDVMEVQRRWKGVNLPLDVVAIDADADLLEWRSTLDDVRPILEAAADALGVDIVKVYPQSDSENSLAGQFGGSPVRGGYHLTVLRIGERMIVEIESTGGRPVRGYVSIYGSMSAGEPVTYRVRATGGVLRVEIPAPDQVWTIGAIVEDDGIPLETRVDGPDGWLDAVGRVHGRSSNGTGFLVASNLVLTTFHTMDTQSTRVQDYYAERTLSVVLNGEGLSREASFVRHDARADWALLRLAEACPVTPLRFGRLADGEEYAFESFGFPGGTPDGVRLSGKLRSLQGDGIEASLDTETALGVSGAPCVVDGRVVAMVSAATRSSTGHFMGQVAMVSMAEVVDGSLGLLSWDDEDRR